MARAFVMSMVGDRAVMMRLGLVGKHTPHDLAKAMVRKGHEIIGDAKEFYVPVDTGALKGSGHVQMPRVTPTGVDVDIGFGGPAGTGNVDEETNKEDVGYALPVHERTDVHHETGGPFFLERAIEKHLPSMAGEFRRNLNAAIKARFGLIN